MKDLQLIVAHLLGGTSGLNLSQPMTDAEIEEKVAAALRVAEEVNRQTHKDKITTDQVAVIGMISGVLALILGMILLFQLVIMSCR